MRNSTEPDARPPMKIFPTFGVLLGTLTLIVECWAIVDLLQVDGSFSSSDLLVALTVFVVLFGGLDFLIQLFLPGMGLALLPRAVLVVGIAYGFLHFIQVPLSFALLSAAAGWTLAQIYCASLWGRFLPFRWVTLAPAAAINNLQTRKTAAVVGSWKRIITEDGTDVTFELASDPAELHPIPAAGVALPVCLPRPAARQKAPHEMDPGTEAALRALGYIR